MKFIKPTHCTICLLSSLFILFLVISSGLIKYIGQFEDIKNLSHLLLAIIFLSSGIMI